MIIGVTGGVGAGKSTVLEILSAEYGAYVIKADEVAHELMRPGMQNYKNIVSAYGDEILLEDGSIDKKKLATRAFSSSCETKHLNEMTHPQVKAAIEAIIKKQTKEKQKGLIVIEAALLSEGGLSELCDSVWYIYADIDTRVRRIMESRGYDRKRCEDTIARQKKDVQFREECNAVIDNSADIERTKEQIRHLMKC